MVAALNGAWLVMASRISSFRFKPQAYIWTSEIADDVLSPVGIAQNLGRPPKDIELLLLDPRQHIGYKALNPPNHKPIAINN